IAFDGKVVYAKAALRALQLNAVAAVEPEELEAPVLGEVVVSTQPVASYPTFAAGVIQGILNIVVQHGIIHICTSVQRKLAADVDVGKEAHTVRVFMPDILVRRANDVVAHNLTHALYGVVGVAIEGGEVQHRPFYERAVGHFVVVCVFRIQLWITNRDIQWIRSFNVRIQEANGRTLYPSVVR